MPNLRRLLTVTALLALAGCDGNSNEPPKGSGGSGGEQSATETGSVPIDMVNAIKKLGAPIDAIGCQAHDLDHMGLGGTVDVSFESVKTRLANLIAVVPNIYITELDISTKDDALQLSLYKQHFQLFWDNPNVKGITIWGWVAGQTWSMAPDSGLITSSGTKRPAFTWLLQTIGKS